MYFVYWSIYLNKYTLTVNHIKGHIIADSMAEGGGGDMAPLSFPSVTVIVDSFH